MLKRRASSSSKAAIGPVWAQVQAKRLCTLGVVVSGLAIGSEEISAQVSPSAIQGREIIMVTGSTDGLGREVALMLAGPEAHIIVHGRNVERGQAVVEEVEAKGATARFIQADLASLAQVRELAATVLRDYDRLDVLVNNAGIGRGQDGAPREVSADGYELRFAVNYLSHFLLTRELLPLLQAAAPSRIVSVSSSAQAGGTIDFSDLMLEREPYEGTRAYGQSKLAQVFMTLDLSEELAGTGVTANAVHPGGYLDTSMVRERGGTANMTAEEGATFVVNAVRSSEAGQYFNTMTVGRANEQAYDLDARRQLRELSMELAELN
jgi:NAD(P)-dependent dehydrogenase (short-subunit alcohol dehydrogenase family)